MALTSPAPRRCRPLAVAGWLGAVVLFAPTASADPSSDFPTDDRGFVGTAAYCQGAAVATAFGRTRNALVAICSSPDGQLQYRGVRLDDDAALMLTATAAGAGGFTAENDGVLYTVTPAELVVSAGKSTLHRQQMLEYHHS